MNFFRPLHEDDDEEEENVVEDDAELTIDKLNDDLAVSFQFSFIVLYCKYLPSLVCLLIASDIQCLTDFLYFRRK